MRVVTECVRLASGRICAHWSIRGQLNALWQLNAQFLKSQWFEVEWVRSDWKSEGWMFANCSRVIGCSEIDLVARKCWWMNWCWLCAYIRGEFIDFSGPLNNPCLLISLLITLERMTNEQFHQEEFVTFEEMWRDESLFWICQSHSQNYHDDHRE